VRKQTRTELWRDQLVALLPRLKRYALSLTSNMADAEDLLHSTVERALDRADQFEQGTDLDRWMFRICKNLWLDEWRSRKVRDAEPLTDNTEHNEAVVDGERQATATIELRELGQVLARLKEEHREILLLIVVEGHSYKEVSQLLGIPIGTVMSRLARARTQLAAKLPRTPTDGNVVPLSKARRP